MDTARASVAVDDARPANADALKAGANVAWVAGRPALQRLVPAWDEARRQTRDPSALLEHGLLMLWLDAFAPNAQPWTVTVASNERVAAAATLLPMRTQRLGLPTRLLTTAGNSHLPRGALIDSTDEAVTRTLAQALAATTQPAGRTQADRPPPWDVLELRDLVEGPTLDLLTQALQATGCRVALRRPMHSPWLPVPQSDAELARRLTSHFRQNLRRRRRRLEEHGPVTVEWHEGLGGLDAALEAAFALEASGWKGRGGTAISDHPETAAFYTAWARRLAKQGRLRLSFLRVGEERIAFQLGLVEGDSYLLPKCAYAERWREHSPGQLLTEAVLRRCREEGLSRFDFLGHDMVWKRDWTNLLTRHATLVAWAPTPIGRLLHLLEARLRPALVRATRRVPRLETLGRRLRGAS